MIGEAPRRLEAVLHEPPGSPRGAVAVCHPHPKYGGDMESNVVVAVARRLAREGLVALRFNFGGVGAMAAQGLPRVSRVITIGRPLGLFDWSFAPALCQRLAVVVGDRDQFCPADALGRFAVDLDMTPTVLRGADHFFGGREDEVAAAVVAHLTVQVQD
ncbi:MAG: alpha/beta hydrolase [Candidatus Binatia bacterium]